jgi:hypothetical protein
MSRNAAYLADVDTPDRYKQRWLWPLHHVFRTRHAQQHDVEVANSGVRARRAQCSTAPAEHYDMQSAANGDCAAPHRCRLRQQGHLTDHPRSALRIAVRPPAKKAWTERFHKEVPHLAQHLARFSTRSCTKTGVAVHWQLPAPAHPLLLGVSSTASGLTRPSPGMHQ